MYYSDELVIDYSNKREQYNETDRVLFGALESIGVKDKIVVDLGCGDGRHARMIKDLGASQVMGVDKNERMIEVAREKNDAPNVVFQVANGEDIPAESDSVDIVVSNYVIHYFLDVKKVFEEIKRILKNNGYFVGTFNITDVDEGFEHLYNQQMPIKLGQGESSIIVQNLIKSREEVMQAIAELGFSIVEEQELEHPNATVDDSFPNKPYIQKRAVLMVLQKIY
jgi:ubiquinone/menaquinone biosynthesis C-methylase UbiE